MNNEKLKPCPFCGDKYPQISSDGGCQYFRVFCHNCKCEKRPTTNDTDSIDGAINSWNTRLILEK